MRVSVIVPTFERVEMLRSLLDSLAGQSYSKTMLEVVTVDDGSPNGLGELPQVSYPFALTCLRQDNAGSAVARNFGAENARGDLFVFLDDDMEVGPDYISGLVSMHADKPLTIGMGMLQPFRCKSASPFERVYASINCEQGVGSTGGDTSFHACVTNNLSVERTAFLEIGGMQDIAGDGPTWWGDVDFGVRAARLGFRFNVVADAACIHKDYSIRDLDTALRRSYAVSRMAPVFLERYRGSGVELPMYRDCWPLQPMSESVRLTLRKLLRRISASTFSVWLLRSGAKAAERSAADSPLLRALYRWSLGAQNYRGFRDGLALLDEG